MTSPPSFKSIDRRTLISTATAATLGTFVLAPVPSAASTISTGSPAELPDIFPAHEAEAVSKVVGASHFSLERVRALVDKRPELAKASWDWGFGDWESALGAASHTANREIVRYLIDNGARPNIFTAAMLGNLSAVQAFVDMSPGIQSAPGPHGITLRRHAQLGGDAAKQVLDYLDDLGDADITATNLPLTIDREAYVGTYTFGREPNQKFKITVGTTELLMIERGDDGTARTLFHQGDHAFHPAGAPSARIAFHVIDGVVARLQIHNPGLLLTASRI